MNKLTRRRIVALSVCSVWLGTSPSLAGAETPSDLRDLVGVRGSSGETMLMARGYEHVRTQTGSESKWSYWWNKSRNQCISVTTFDGRYEAIDKTSAKDCGKSGSSATGAAVAVGAVALIGALALATRKRDNDRYDRYPPGSSGSTPYELRDLLGVKASYGERSLRNRGYKQQFGEGGGYGRWSYWWNKREDQCIAVTTYDGRYQSLVSAHDSSCGKGSSYSGGGYGYGSQSYSPSGGITCYPAQRACYEAGRGYSAYWSSREFRY